ncbi:MAG: hypothetical protein R6V85_13035 [Polyangia bacterium]
MILAALLVTLAGCDDTGGDDTDVVFIIDNSSGGPNSTLCAAIHDWIKACAQTPDDWMETFVDLDRFYVFGHFRLSLNNEQPQSSSPLPRAGFP